VNSPPPNPNFSIRLPESGSIGRIPATTSKIRQNRPKSEQYGRNSKISTRFWPYWSDSDQFDRNMVRRNPTTVAKSHFTLLVIFSYEPNVEKYFQENLFFFFFVKKDFIENIVRRKTFYAETNEGLILFFPFSQCH
jgi:hypothetical protein